METPTAYAAIRTRFFGQTNKKGARIIANRSATGCTFNLAERITKHYDYELDSLNNHYEAAALFLAKYNQFKTAMISKEGLCFDNDYYWTWRT
tara:strand:- start:199 stop:477 length:279 start_codon:yes stop_codon:yes gene_type:complete